MPDGGARAWPQRAFESAAEARYAHPLMISSGVSGCSARWGSRLFACGAFAVAVLAGLRESAHAQSVLSFKYTPAPRAQLAVWIEDGTGQFMATVALTEAVGYRGIGNRPGASNMNSGYRWPYGRREGVLPVWAHRRASAPGALLFPRVIFQNRVEGLASRTTSDQSPDAYYCLQFDIAKSSRDELDAVSCATPFSSDKGRYLTAQDIAAGYAEPYETQPGAGTMMALPLQSYYPPRMDVSRCTSTSCYDHADVDRFGADVRAAMPEIDAITIATPPGDAPQNILFSVPKSWPQGDYAAFIEVNVEGDYNDAWNDHSFPTPQTPSSAWDYYALHYGYAYRGQPSLVWKATFSLRADGTVHAVAAQPIGRSSWDYYKSHYGELEALSMAQSDPSAVSASIDHSGVQRLRANAAGERFSVDSKPSAGPTQMPTSGELDAGMGVGMSMDAGTVGPQPSAAGKSALDAGTPDAMSGDAGAPLADAGSAHAADPSPPRAVEELSLQPYPDALRAHTWVQLRMRAARAELPLHAYEVRVATEPITDVASFIRNGRQAKNATDAAEGATSLSLPADVPAGQWIDTAIGDLVAETHYYVGVRATDEANQPGPIAVAEITTAKRSFATVTPCFVASVAYGSPLAAEVGVLRRVRDRYLLPQALGRSAVAAYYRVGAQAAAWLRPHHTLRDALRLVLTPAVGLARTLESDGR
jgi:hypothetical protein